MSKAWKLLTMDEASSVTELLCDEEKWQAILAEVRQVFGDLVSCVMRFASQYDEVFGTHFRDVAMEWHIGLPTRAYRELSSGDASRLDVDALLAMAADARRRLDALEDGFDDCREVCDFAARVTEHYAKNMPRKALGQIFAEERALARRHGWPPLFTIVACVTVVTSVEQVAEPLKTLAAYPDDGVPVDEWFREHVHAGAVASALAARDALLAPCRQVTSVLRVANSAMWHPRAMVRDHRRTTSPPPAKERPSFGGLFRCFSFARRADGVLWMFR